MKNLPQKECASGCVDVCVIQTDGSELYELNITTCFEISKPYCTTSTTNDNGTVRLDLFI